MVITPLKNNKATEFRNLSLAKRVDAMSTPSPSAASCHDSPGSGHDTLTLVSQVATSTGTSLTARTCDSGLFSSKAFQLRTQTVMAMVSLDCAKLRRTLNALRDLKVDVELLQKTGLTLLFADMAPWKQARCDALAQVVLTTTTVLQHE